MYICKLHCKFHRTRDFYVVNYS